MKETPNELEQIIKEEVQKEADDIKAAVQESEQEDLSEEKKDEIRQNLQKQIEEYQKEKIYAKRILNLLIRFFLLLFSYF